MENKQNASLTDANLEKMIKLLESIDWKLWEVLKSLKPDIK